MNCLEVFSLYLWKVVQTALDWIFFLFFLLACFTESNYGGKIPIVCFAQGGGKETLKVSLFLLLISRSDSRDIALIFKTGYSTNNLIYGPIIYWSLPSTCYRNTLLAIAFKLMKFISVKIFCAKFLPQADILENCWLGQFGCLSSSVTNVAQKCFFLVFIWAAIRKVFVDHAALDLFYTNLPELWFGKTWLAHAQWRLVLSCNIQGRSAVLEIVQPRACLNWLVVAAPENCGLRLV